MKRTKESLEEKLLYRTQMQVEEVITFKSGDTFPICPRCGISMERDYQSYCDRCGQALKWKGFMKSKIRYV